MHRPFPKGLRPLPPVASIISADNREMVARSDSRKDEGVGVEIEAGNDV